MQRLIEGISRFQSEVFPRHRDLFRSLASGQRPQTLFITCSDSRVVPNIMLSAGPGELFIIRNAGNIVPPHGEPAGGVSATIEYAVEVLGVREVVVCGHSDCGAARAAMNPEAVASLKAVSAWLRHAERAAAVVHETAAKRSEAERLEIMIEENVVAQMANLGTHPCVAARLKSGRLEVHGWTFDIATGSFRVYDPAEGAFVPLDLRQAGAPIREVAHG
jgi:carbonic anhydrase